MPKKKNASSLISDLNRKTRRIYSSEEKIRIIIDGLRGEITIAELCRKDGISQGLYYKWSKDFMEAGKKRLIEGFTGPQMATAVSNMYSSSPKNEWHIKSGFVNATPEFLLKNDNLNKYLNQRF